MGYFASSVDQPLDKAIANAANAGKMFMLNTGAYSPTTTTPWQGISLFWAARATKIVVVGAKGFDLNATAAIQLRITTTDPALSGNSISGIAIQNGLVGSSTTSSASLSSATTGISNATGTLWRAMRVSTNQGLGAAEMLLKPSDYIVIPPNVARGVLLITGSAATTDAVQQELVWIEI